MIRSYDVFSIVVYVCRPVVVYVICVFIWRVVVCSLKIPADEISICVLFIYRHPIYRSVSLLVVRSQVHLYHPCRYIFYLIDRKLIDRL